MNWSADYAATDVDGDPVPYGENDHETRYAAPEAPLAGQRARQEARWKAAEQAPDLETDEDMTPSDIDGATVRRARGAFASLPERLYTQAEMKEAVRNASINYADTNAVAMSLNDKVQILAHQLHAARYCYHKQIAKRYGDAVSSGLMSTEEGRERYRAAMANYDGIITESANGHLTEANGADMEKGFSL